MPLGGDHPPRRSVLDAFDDAVVGAAGDDQPVSDAVGSLMVVVMTALRLGGTERVGQARPRVELHRAVAAPVRVGADVLMQRAAAGDVHHLQASAQTEHRHVDGDRGVAGQAIDALGNGLNSTVTLLEST
ncbi:MAG TPA: hypothetical protein PLV68_15160, partial [Ilumatobacteraceae bacterium]|nr:hypothetical protein [Ilumatobacteraceae bacterium]